MTSLVKATEVIARELRTLEIYLTNPDMITQWDRIKSIKSALTVALQVMEEYEKLQEKIDREISGLSSIIAKNARKEAELEAELAKLRREEQKIREATFKDHNENFRLREALKTIHKKLGQFTGEGLDVQELYTIARNALKKEGSYTHSDMEVEGCH